MSLVFMRTLKFKFIPPEGYEGKSYSRLSPWFVDGHFNVDLTLSLAYYCVQTAP